jgi:hypothetical protein
VQEITAHVSSRERTPLSIDILGPKSAPHWGNKPPAARGAYQFVVGLRRFETSPTPCAAWHLATIDALIEAAKITDYELKMEEIPGIKDQHFSRGRFDAIVKDFQVVKRAMGGGNAWVLCRFKPNARHK